MKRLICEVCGSNGFTKRDGLFVCDYCETKYTSQEAQKIIIEGPIIIERYAELDKLTALVEQSFEQQKYADLETFAGEVVRIVPDDEMMHFYRNVGIAGQHTPLLFFERDHAIFAPYERASFEQKEELAPLYVQLFENLYRTEAYEAVHEWWALKERTLEAYFHIVNTLKEFVFSMQIHKMPQMEDVEKMKDETIQTMMHMLETLSKEELKMYDEGKVIPRQKADFTLRQIAYAPRVCLEMSFDALTDVTLKKEALHRYVRLTKEVKRMTIAVNHGALIRKHRVESLLTEQPFEQKIPQKMREIDKILKEREIEAHWKRYPEEKEKLLQELEQLERDVENMRLFDLRGRARASLRKIQIKNELNLKK